MGGAPLHLLPRSCVIVVVERTNERTNARREKKSGEEGDLGEDREGPESYLDRGGRRKK